MYPAYVRRFGGRFSSSCVFIRYSHCSPLTKSLTASDLVLQRALVIEKSCHSTLNNTEYRQKIRQLFTYFSDKKNPSLKERVVSGELPADKLATMSSADMASDQQKDERAKIEAENLFLTLGAGEQQAETDAFQCGKCKQVRLTLLVRRCELTLCFSSENAAIARPRRGVLMNP